MGNVPDYYRILMVPPGASQDEVRRQYRRLAAVYHPDQNLQVRRWAEEQMQHLNEAYAVLGDDLRRRAYDETTGLVRGKALLSPRGNWRELAMLERWTPRAASVPGGLWHAFVTMLGVVLTVTLRFLGGLYRLGTVLLAPVTTFAKALSGREGGQWARGWVEAWRIAGEPPYLLFGAIFYVKRLDGTPVPGFLYPLGLLLDLYHLVFGRVLFWFCGDRPGLTIPLSLLVGPLLVLLPDWSWQAALPGAEASPLGDWMSVSLFLLLIMGTAHAGFSILRRRRFDWWVPIGIWMFLSTAIFLFDAGQLLLAEVLASVALGATVGLSARWFEERAAEHEQHEMQRADVL